MTFEPILVTARSTTCVCGRSFIGIAGSNHAGGIDVCIFVSVVRCRVEVSAMGQSLVQSSRTVCGVFVCVISKPLKLGGLGVIRVVSIK